MAKFRIDYFLKEGNPLYRGRRIEKDFNNSKEALLWCAENISDKSTCFEINQLSENLFR